MAVSSTSNNANAQLGGAAVLNANGGDLVNAGAVINLGEAALNGVIGNGQLLNNINLGVALAPQIQLAPLQVHVLNINGAIGNPQQGQMNINITPGSTINFGTNAVINSQLNITDGNGQHLTINPGTNVAGLTIQSTNGQLQVKYKLDLKGPLFNLDFFDHHHHDDQDPDDGACGFGVLVGENDPMVEAY